MMLIEVKLQLLLNCIHILFCAIKSQYSTHGQCKVYSQVLQVLFECGTSPYGLQSNQSKLSVAMLISPSACHRLCSKGLVINYAGGGATKWENRGSELTEKNFLDPRPLTTGYNISRPPPF